MIATKKKKRESRKRTHCQKDRVTPKESEAFLCKTRQVRSLRKKDGFVRFAENVTSQNGEDGIIREILAIIFKEEAEEVLGISRRVVDIPDGTDGGKNGSDERGEEREASKEEATVDVSPGFVASDDAKRRQSTIRRWCVDVGAWDGKHLSNTYALTHPPSRYPSNSWSGVFVEANAGRFRELTRLYADRARSLSSDSCSDTNAFSDVSSRLLPSLPPASLVVDAGECAKGPIGVASSAVATTSHVVDPSTVVPSFDNALRTSVRKISCGKEASQTYVCVCREISCEKESIDLLSTVLKDHVPDLPKAFDFLSVDVDGVDYWILVDLLESGYRPKLICVEFNPTMPHSVLYVQARRDSVRHGSSLAAFVSLLNEAAYDYVLIETTLFNAFFVPRRVYEKGRLRATVPDTCLEVLNECTMGTRLYQLYDGTIKLDGCKKLLWHRIRMREADMQVLSMKQRGFPFAPPPAPA